MCEFCRNPAEYKKYGVPIRNSYDSDNFCEVLYDNDCEDCSSGCADKNFHFTIYKWQESLSFGFIHATPKCTIAQTSEMVAINYCPWCGEKISEQEVPFEKCSVEKLFSTER